MLHVKITRNGVVTHAEWDASTAKLETVQFIHEQAGYEVEILRYEP